MKNVLRTAAVALAAMTTTIWAGNVNWVVAGEGLPDTCWVFLVKVPTSNASTFEHNWVENDAKTQIISGGNPLLQWDSVNEKLIFIGGQIVGIAATEDFTTKKKL